MGAGAGGAGVGIRAGAGAGAGAVARAGAGAGAWPLFTGTTAAGVAFARCTERPSARGAERGTAGRRRGWVAGEGACACAGARCTEGCPAGAERGAPSTGRCRAGGAVARWTGAGGAAAGAGAGAGAGVGVGAGAGSVGGTAGAVGGRSAEAADAVGPGWWAVARVTEGFPVVGAPRPIRRTPPAALRCTEGVPEPAGAPRPPRPGAGWAGFAAGVGAEPWGWAAGAGPVTAEGEGAGPLERGVLLWTLSAGSPVRVTALPGVAALLPPDAGCTGSAGAGLPVRSGASGELRVLRRTLSAEPLVRVTASPGAVPALPLDAGCTGAVGPSAGARWTLMAGPVAAVGLSARAGASGELRVARRTLSAGPPVRVTGAPGAAVEPPSGVGAGAAGGGGPVRVGGAVGLVAGARWMLTAGSPVRGTALDAGCTGAAGVGLPVRAGGAAGPGAGARWTLSAGPSARVTGAPGVVGVPPLDVGEDAGRTGSAGVRLLVPAGGGGELRVARWTLSAGPSLRDTALPGVVGVPPLDAGCTGAAGAGSLVRAGGAVGPAAGARCTLSAGPLVRVTGVPGAAVVPPPDADAGEDAGRTGSAEAGALGLAGVALSVRAGVAVGPGTGARWTLTAEPPERFTALPGALATGPAEPARAEPDLAAPVVEAPDAPGPGEAGPDDTGPDEAAPDEAGPDVPGPCEPEPDGAGLAEAGPDGAGPDGAGPDGTEPDDTGPDDTGPDDTGPDEAGPRETVPDEVGPPRAGPVVAGPDAADPVVVGPDEVGPAVAGPDVVDPVVAGPGVVVVGGVGRRVAGRVRRCTAGAAGALVSGFGREGLGGAAVTRGPFGRDAVTGRDARCTGGDVSPTAGAGSASGPATGRTRDGGSSPATGAADVVSAFRISPPGAPSRTAWDRVPVSEGFCQVLSRPPNPESATPVCTGAARWIGGSAAQPTTGTGAEPPPPAPGFASGAGVAAVAGADTGVAAGTGDVPPLSRSRNPTDQPSAPPRVTRDAICSVKRRRSWCSRSRIVSRLQWKW